MHENLQLVKDILEKQCNRKNKNNNINIIAVSKNIEIEKIIPVLDDNHKIFGENKVQECIKKWIPLKQKYDNICLHFIGHLQTNKVKYLPNLVDVIQTLDRETLAKQINKIMTKNPDWKPKIFIQINTSNEPQKSGIDIKNADNFIQKCINKYKLPIVGLMNIPKIDEHSALHFATLRKIAKKNNLTQLSMGMSGDYIDAIDFDTTHIRVGRAIFGNRK